MVDKILKIMVKSPRIYVHLGTQAYSCRTPVIPVESSGIQWSPVKWDRIPVDCTELQTEIEIELEYGCEQTVLNKNMIYKLNFLICQ